MIKTKSHYILIFILAALLFFSLSSNLQKPPSAFYDIWEHLAALRELTYHPGDTFHPMVLIKTSYRGYAPFYFILSKLSVMWKKDVFWSYKIGGLLNFFLYSFFLSGFLGRAFGFDAKTKSIALLTTLFLWGSPWMLSSVYSFNTITLTAGYPSFFGFAMSIGSLYYLHGYLYQNSRKDLLLSVILFGLFFISYLPVLPLYLMNAALITPKNKKKVFLSVSIFLSVISISFLWPLFWLKSTITNLINHVGDTNPLQPGTILKQVLPSILGISGLALSKSEVSKFCRRGFIAFISLTIIAFKFNNSLWGRLLLFSIFYLQIGFSAYLGRFVSGFIFSMKELTSRNYLPQKGFIIIFFIILCYQAFKVHQGNMMRSNIPMKSYQEIGSILGDRDIVLSDPVTGGPLPAFGPKIVAPIQQVIGISDQHLRQKDVSFFFSYPEKTKQCYEIMSRYQAGYVLINKEMRGYERFGRFGEIIYWDDFLILVRAGKKNRT